MWRPCAANRPQVRYSSLNDLMKIGGIGSGTQSAYQLGLHAIGLLSGTDAIYDSIFGLNENNDCFNNKLYKSDRRVDAESITRFCDIPVRRIAAGHLMLPCSRFKTKDAAFSEEERQPAASL